MTSPHPSFFWAPHKEEVVDRDNGVTRVKVARALRNPILSGAFLRALYFTSGTALEHCLSGYSPHCGDRCGCECLSRAFGVGPIATYSTEIGKSHIDFNARWVHEFDNQKRPEGDMFQLSASLKS